MDVAEHISALEREGRVAAAAASRRGLGAPVPACPGWQVRDLLRHLGYVHRWATAYVSQGRQEMIGYLPESEILQAGPADTDLPGWFSDGLDALVAALTSADPGLSCWTFFAAPSPLAFWARRQSHETAIHRADAEGTPVTPFPAAFAADGVDEVLTGFAPRSKFSLPAAGTGGGPGAAGRRLLVQATDTGEEWLTEIGPRITAWRLGAGGTGDAGAGGAGPGAPADCVLAGPASDLYLLLWNRQQPDSPVTVSGDGEVVDLWRSRIQVTW